MYYEEIYNKAYNNTLEKIAEKEGFWKQVANRALEYGQEKNRSIDNRVKASNQRTSTNQFKSNKDRVTAKNKSFLNNKTKSNGEDATK